MPTYSSPHRMGQPAKRLRPQSWSRPGTNIILSQWSLWSRQKFGNSWWSLWWPVEANQWIAVEDCSKPQPSKRSNWKDAIDKFLLEPLTPEEKRYAKELELWYEKDLDLKKALKDLKELIHEEFREMKEKEALRGQPVGQYYRLLVGRLYVMY